MPIHKLKLIDKKIVAESVITLFFEKPAGFQFTPGQYGGFTLLNQTDLPQTQLTRRFSILSSPADEHIAIVTRIQSSPYKQALNNLQVGEEIKFAGPTGVFTLHTETNVPAVFIAGGIGISPFHSMIKHAKEQGFPQHLYLFYGNNTLQTSAFLSELAAFACEKFQMIATLAAPSEGWLGETGFITQSMIKKYLPDLNAPFYYICGAPQMVTTLQETLAEMGIDEDRIKVEDFPGY